MSSNSDQANYNELAGKIQQFLSHQIESNSSLSDAAKESLTVATECIEQAYDITRGSPSRELMDIYNSHKSASSQQQQQQQQSITNQQPPMVPDPAQLITNLASSLFSQVGGSLASAAAGLANQQPAAQQQQTNTETQPEQLAQPSAPPKTRKNATDAEKLAAESFKNQGNDLMKQEKCKEAYYCYTQAIEIDDNNAVFYCNRAAASAKLGNHEAALADCREAIEIDPNYSKAYGRMGLSYANMENHQKAKEAYVKAVELDPTSETYRNNLRIAEEKIASGQGGLGAGFGGLGGLGAQMGAGGQAGAGGGPNFTNMMQSLINNPQVMNMAMRSLQDPRLQGLFSNLADAAAPGAGGGGGGGNQNNNQQPR